MIDEPVEYSLRAAEPVPASLSAHNVTRCNDNAVTIGRDNLIEETPIAFVYNGISHAVMLATPNDLDDFALGFSLSENIVNSARDIYACEINPTENGIELQLTIAAERAALLKERRRNLAGRTGCGLCGVESLQAALRQPQPVAQRPRVTVALVARALAALPQQQPLYRASGAVHAAAWINLKGAIHTLREDVGRHNALDKLIGALTRAGIEPASGFVIVTSRASYEMVQKVATFGAGLLIAISAPTAYAVRLAGQCGVALAGFAREDRLSVYTYPDAIDTYNHHISN
jgi:formate dehydrogenase accessory protein FdhD